MTDLLCPECGAGSSPGKRFCGDCGARLPGGEEESRHGESSADRRQLTVMFCDLVKSTELSHRLDPEDLRDVMRAYQDVCAAAIERLDGRIAQTLGDGLMVYFGYPRAREDDAIRSVLAGLDILDAVRRLSRRLRAERDIAISVRIGVHTGLVVAGKLGGADTREEMAIVGETPNIAARLQGLAEPDTMLIGPVTSRLVKGHFITESLGRKALKGIATGLLVERVVGRRAAESRFDATAASRGVSTLVGREQDLRRLEEAWHEASDARGQVVLLTGEAGVGKSRIVRALSERIDLEDHARLTLQSSPYHTKTALYPVLDPLQATLGFDRGETVEARLEKIDSWVAAGRVHGGEAAPLLADLLSLPHGGRYAPVNLSPQRQRQRILALVADAFLALTVERPVLMLVEDAHWADPTTLELLGVLAERVAGVRALLVVTCRTDFELALPPSPHVTRHVLDRLARDGAAAIVRELVHGKALPEGLLEHVLRRTDGVPLFVEELTKAILETGLLEDRGGRFELTGPLETLEIPATLKDSLMARLDRLPEAKRLAQVAALIGRSFSTALLARVAGEPVARAREALDLLVAAGLLMPHGDGDEGGRYSFRHALVQETAYESLLRSGRRALHLRAARALEEELGTEADADFEPLARHFTEASELVPAARYWLAAAERAVSRSAQAEALSHYKAGLAAVGGLPPTTERHRLELDLQAGLSVALMSTRGWGAPEVEAAVARAQELGSKTGDPEGLFRVSFGAVVFRLTRGPHAEAERAIRGMLELGEQTGDTGILGWAHMFLTAAGWFGGRFEEARGHADQMLRHYDAALYRPFVQRMNHEPKSHRDGYLGQVLCAVGLPDQATRLAADNVAATRELFHPFSLAIAHVFQAFVHVLTRNLAGLAAGLDEAAEICSREGFSNLTAHIDVLEGWRRAQEGQSRAGVERAKQGVTNYKAIGSQAILPWYLVLYGEALALDGDRPEALQVLDQAFAKAEEIGERSHLAEIHRIRGEVLSGLPEQRAEAETSLRRAVAVAEEQRAAGFRLRAAIPLAALLRERSTAEARAVLAPALSAMTEGFTTADVRAARSLLDEIETEAP